MLKRLDIEALFERLISLVCFSSINQNILRNLFLCQNIEDLILKGRFLIRDTFLSISQLSKLKRLKIDKFPSDLFEFASWPSLERLWIEGPFLDSSTKLVSDESIKTLISRSPHLKSFHLVDTVTCDISNEVMFDICKETNIFVSFGKVRSHNPESPHWT